MKQPIYDPRPRQHIRYVPTGPRRRIPILRVLLLVGLGTLTYTHFDPVWKFLRARLPTLTHSPSTLPPSVSTPLAPHSRPSNVAPQACMNQATAHLDAEARTIQWKGNQAAVFPVLPGRITRLDSLGPSEWEVEMYHGRELYSRYSDLRKLAPGLHSGSELTQRQPLGEAGLAEAESGEHTQRRGADYAVTLQMEQAGMFRDPRSFFNGETAHAP